MKSIKVKVIVALVLCVVLTGVFYKVITNIDLNPNYEVGEVIDSLHGVDVYYNGGVNTVVERNTTSDGYNIGLKYQCVEFVKRYYLEHYKHRMPDTYGHAKDFFDQSVKQGQISPRRGLKQFRNAGNVAPKVGDLMVYKPSLTNPYGHVAIVSAVDLSAETVEVIQQNAGPFSPSRETYLLKQDDDNWQLKNERVLGWLRL